MPKRIKSFTFRHVKYNRKKRSSLNTVDGDPIGLNIEDGKYCTCGNPSGEGYIHFEGHEDLIYTCVDCNKQVKD